MPVNRIVYQGNLVRDVEMADTRDSDIANFTVANTRKYKQKEDTCFLDCVAYGKTAENVNKYFGKGDPIIVEGRLTQNEWEDRKSGDKRSKIVLTVESFHFAGDTGNKRGDGDRDRGGRDSGRGHDNDRGRGRDRDRDGRDRDRDREERGSDRSRGRDDRDHRDDDPRDADIPF